MAPGGSGFRAYCVKTQDHCPEASTVSLERTPEGTLVPGVLCSRAISHFHFPRSLSTFMLCVWTPGGWVPRGSRHGELGWGQRGPFRAPEGSVSHVCPPQRTVTSRPPKGSWKWVWDVRGAPARAQPPSARVRSAHPAPKGPVRRPDGCRVRVRTQPAPGRAPERPEPNLVSWEQARRGARA